MYPKISKYISVAVISLLLPFASYAQQTESEKTQQTVEDLTKKEAPVFGGVALRPRRRCYEIPQFGLLANGSGRTLEFQGEIFSGF